MKHIKSAVKHQASTGEVERFVQTFKKAMKKAKPDEQVKLARFFVVKQDHSWCGDPRNTVKDAYETRRDETAVSSETWLRLGTILEASFEERESEKIWGWWTSESERFSDSFWKMQCGDTRAEPL